MLLADVTIRDMMSRRDSQLGSVYLLGLEGAARKVSLTKNSAKNTISPQQSVPSGG